MNKKVTIVGAGVGGLATAARLAHRGYEVLVLEKLPECGGRAHLIEDRGFKFDTGPSFVLMPDFFEEIFSYCGEDIKNHLELIPLDIHYKIFYPDGETFTVFRESEGTKQEMEKLVKGSSRSYDAFIAETSQLYNTVKPLLYRCFTKKDLLHPLSWKMVFALNPFSTYWRTAQRHFKSDKLCYAFTFESMFIGVSPFSAPSFYSIITYVDHVQKIFHPRGGMYQIPKALESLATTRGARFNYQTPVSRITTRYAKPVINIPGGELVSDLIVVNADYAYTQTELLGRRLPHYRYSCSVYLLYLGLSRKVEGLQHHNLFFAQDVKKNLSEIFIKQIVPQDPSFYIHVPTVTDPSLAPEGKEIVYVLIPIPHLRETGESFVKQEEKLKKCVLDRLNRTLHLDLEPLIETAHSFYPQDFISRYHIKYGATFGLAHTLFQSAFFRPPNRDHTLPHLFYVGASTQPGGGLPPVIASSRIVADLITGESRPVT